MSKAMMMIPPTRNENLDIFNEGSAKGAYKFINIITNCVQDGDSKSI